MLKPLTELNPARFDSPAILKKLNAASRSLAEFKGVIPSVPHDGILINTLGIQEAKDSSAIENIVTTHDQLYREEGLPEAVISGATKEVYRYRQAMAVGFSLVQRSGLITINHLIQTQAALLLNGGGIRTLPGTTLRNTEGQTVYTPPQDHGEILNLLRDLESFMNDSTIFDADPLIKMALIHHQFESIHPFYDGNGRSGRILNVLYLVKEGLLNIPVLYLSRPLVQSKGEYYRLLQGVREHDDWESWVIYMLSAVESSAKDAVVTIEAIRDALLSTKHRIRSENRFYSQDLINNLFSHPYTKIEFLTNSLGVSRHTAASYLEALTKSGVLHKRKIGRSNYYVNTALWAILAGERMQTETA